MGGAVRIVQDASRLRPPDSEVWRLWCDNRKMRAATGFQPRVSLRTACDARSSGSPIRAGSIGDCPILEVIVKATRAPAFRSHYDGGKSSGLYGCFNGLLPPIDSCLTYDVSLVDRAFLFTARIM
jgi:hypothetical protein